MSKTICIYRLMRLDIPIFKDYGNEASPLLTLFTKAGARILLELFVQYVL